MVSTDEDQGAVLSYQIYGVLYEGLALALRAAASGPYQASGQLVTTPAMFLDLRTSGQRVDSG